MTKIMKRHVEIAIVGAGPSGIKAAKELLAAFPQWRSNRSIVILEESSRVGGIWHKNGKVDRPDYGAQLRLRDADCPDTLVHVVTSSQPIYNGLTANVFRDWMNFPDLPYPRDANLLPSTEEIESYFEEYTVVHNLKPFIKFTSRVEKCEKVHEEGHWRISTVQNELEITSNRLLVCTGHHRKPFVPESIAGIRHFKGHLVHSSGFCSPDQLISMAPSKDSSLKILVVGGGISGADIAKICAKHPNVHVAVSVRNWRTVPHALMLGKFRENGTIRSGVNHIDTSGEVHFNESHVQGVLSTPMKPDIILFATGYRYAYPFLEVPQEVEKRFCAADGFKTQQLYMRILYAHDPSLAFIGIPTQVLSPMILIDYQTRWYVDNLKAGKFQNITSEEMMDEILSRAGDMTQDALQILPGFYKYCNSLAESTTDLDSFWRHFFKERFFPLLASLWRLVVVPWFANKWKAKAS